MRVDPPGAEYFFFRELLDLQHGINDHNQGRLSLKYRMPIFENVSETLQGPLIQVKMIPFYNNE